MTFELCLSHESFVEMDTNGLNSEIDTASDAGFNAMDFVFVSCSGVESDIKKLSEELYDFSDELMNAVTLNPNQKNHTEHNGNSEQKDTLLKLALSVSAAASPTAATKSQTEATTTSVPVSEKMITRTEVTDEKSQLRKILYQSDTKDEKKVENGDGHVDDDDRRLVIAISDDDGCEMKMNSPMTTRPHKPKKHVRWTDLGEKQLPKTNYETHPRQQQGKLYVNCDENVELIRILKRYRVLFSLLFLKDIHQ